MMFIHVRYGAEKEEYVMEFQNEFITVADVWRKAKKRYGKKCRLQLVNEHNERLPWNEKVEKARSYQVRRRVRILEA